MQGRDCREDMVGAGVQAAERLVRYEGAHEPVVTVKQGEEPQQLLSALGTEAGTMSSISPQPEYNPDFEVSVCSMRHEAIFPSTAFTRLRPQPVISIQPDGHLDLSGKSVLM